MQRRPTAVRTFLTDNNWLDHEVLRPLSHIRANWELSWDHASQGFLPEEDSFAQLLNELIDELVICRPPARYHDNEDRLGEYVQQRLRWPVRKVGRSWVSDKTGRLGVEDYTALLEQGGFDDSDERDLVLAAAGRIKAALDRGQRRFDQMELSHQKMLAGVLSVILYHRS